MKPEPKCLHSTIPTPNFDLVEARKIIAQFANAAERIQQKWPRTEATCPDCGSYIILYASTEHYIYGDY